MAAEWALEAWQRGINLGEDTPWHYESMQHPRPHTYRRNAVGLMMYKTVYCFWEDKKGGGLWGPEIEMLQYWANGHGMA